MYRHILLSTDGSDLADRAVTHALSLAKAIGAKVTVLTVESTFNVYDIPSSRMLQVTEAFTQHAEHAKAHAAKVLGTVAEAAKAAGVPCETLQMEHDHAYEAIINAAPKR